MGLDQFMRNLTTKKASGPTEDLITRACCDVCMPAQVLELKQRLLHDKLGLKTRRFSFSRMRHVVIPPVEIPVDLRSIRLKNALVAGRRVPMTRSMWDRQKRSLSTLDGIREVPCLEQTDP
ncbi:TPA: hypothetical protein N0F65_006564 [Lagenidium giganteum]|uniref:Uncharacterized protein n=1 Tax=Lagenidium giganteum TaxID=4803 RepID=A0AAV2YME4_9STRA|nr:TPA: hypothetical protein N0F65_006564 [Lagenidium giganteum]